MTEPIDTTALRSNNEWMDWLGDPDEWGQPVREKKSEKRRRAVVVSVRLSLKELEFIENAAQSRKEPMSTFLREHALSAGPIVEVTVTRPYWPYLVMSKS